MAGIQVENENGKVTDENPLQVTLINEAAPTGTFALLVPSTLSSGDNTLVADPGDNFQAGLVYGTFQNVDTVTRTLILKHGSTVFASVDIPTGQSFSFAWEREQDYWFAAASTSIVANASAGSAIKLVSGKSFVRAV